jgi:hypothetical protein
MSAFQLVSLSLVGALLLLCLGGIIRGWITRRLGIVWLLLWLGVGTAIAYPSLTTLAAHALGIGRGADLVLYCGLLVMLVGFFLIYLRLRRLEASVTTIVRHIALQEAVPPEEW